MNSRGHDWGPGTVSLCRRHGSPGLFGRGGASQSGAQPVLPPPPPPTTGHSPARLLSRPVCSPCYCPAGAGSQAWGTLNAGRASSGSHVLVQFFKYRGFLFRASLFAFFTSANVGVLLDAEHWASWAFRLSTLPYTNPFPALVGTGA